MYMYSVWRLSMCEPLSQTELPALLQQLRQQIRSTDQIPVRTAQMTWQRLQHFREVTIVAIGSLWTEKIDWKEKDLTGFEYPIKNWFQHDTQAVGTSSRRCLLCWKMRPVLLSSGNWTHPSESPFIYPTFQNIAFRIRPRCRRNSDLLLIP